MPSFLPTLLTKKPFMEIIGNDRGPTRKVVLVVEGTRPATEAHTAGLGGPGRDREVRYCRALHGCQYCGLMYS